MANSNLGVLLQAKLDKSGINTELSQIQQIVNKYHLDIMPDLKEASLRNRFKSVCGDMANDFNKTFGTQISGKDVFKVYIDQAKKLEKEMDKVNKSKIAISSTEAENKIAQLNNYLLKNTALTSQAKNTVKGWISEYAKGDVTSARVKEINASFKTLDMQMRKSGHLGRNVFDAMSDQAKKFGQWVSVSAMIMKAFQEVKNGVAFVSEMDDALTNVNYTMDVSTNQLTELGKSSIDLGKQLNTSATNVLSAVKLYANANETTQSILKKSETSIMMSNVTGFDTTQTSSILQGVSNQFDIDDLTKISDVMQNISGSIAYDFSDGVQQIGEAVSTAGESAHLAGEDLETFAAQAAKIIEVTRESGSTVGNSLKSIFTRITKASYTGEASDESISDAETALNKIGVKVRDSTKEFRDLSDIFTDLSAKWKDLSSVEQSNVSFAIAGTRQTNIIKALMQNYGDVETLADNARSSMGTTFENQDKYADSLKGHLGEVKVQLESIWSSLIDSDELKGLVDIGSGMLSVVGQIVDKVGLLPPIVGLVGTKIASMKGLD